MGSVESRIGPVEGRIGSVGIDSEVPIGDSSRGVAPREGGTGSGGDQKEGGDRQDGSNLSMAVACLCLHRTRSCSLGHTAASSLVAEGEHLGLLGSHYRTLAART